VQSRGTRTVDSTWSWVVTGAAFVVLFLAYGASLSFGVFFPSLEKAFNADRAATSLVFSIIGGLYSTLGIVSGPAADRFGTRLVCLFGTTLAGIGLIYASSATALWQVYLGFGVGVSFGMGFNFAPASAGLQRWFTKRRGLASGIASTGIGISILTMPAMVAYLIDAYDWRTAMMAVGIATLVIGGAAALLMGDPPGSTGRTIGNSASAAQAFDVRGALLSRGFVMLYLSSMFCCVGVFIPFVHLVAYSVDQGLSQQTGVFLIASIGVASVIGRLFLTAISDRVSRRNLLAVMYLMQGLGLLLWFQAGAGDSVNVTMLSVFTVLFGIGYGGYVSMIAPMLAAYFGTQRIGSMLGILMSSIAIGAFFGPWLMGQAFDVWGSYYVPIIGSGLLGLAAGLVVMLMPARAYAAKQFTRKHS
jgi:OFA family oxalate/formate antiporter-like MFS transporter